MVYKTLQFDREGKIGILTLTVPGKLNAHTKEMREELIDFWRERQAGEKDCTVIIMTGAGRAFCAGGDIDEIGDEERPMCKRSLQEIYDFQTEIAGVILMMRRAPQPIIAAIRGYAMGGGFSFAMACDIRVADPTAKFTASYINIGLSAADMGSTFFLPREVNLGFAAEYLYTGEMMSAEVAQKIGFVNYVVPSGELMPKAKEIAGKIAAKSGLGLRLTKEAINQNIGSTSLESALHWENRSQVICLAAGPISNPFKRKGGK